MPRYALLVAYDGTDFCGWQKQEPPASAGPAAQDGAGPAYSPHTPLLEGAPEGRVSLRTVQGVLERVVRQVVREPVELIGASRTDSGVHAEGQVCAFTCQPLETTGPSPIADAPPAPRGVGWPADRGPARLCQAVNARLPDDVAVLAAAAVPAGFDPVAGAVRKRYTYTIQFGPQRPLWDRRTVHFVRARPGALPDTDAMRDAAAALVGTHDFAAFAAAGHGRLSTVRTVHACQIALLPSPRDAGTRLEISIEGGGFLWNMVRIIAGTLLEVGLGRRDRGSTRAALRTRDRRDAGPTLAPTGLCLRWVRYEPPPAFVHASEPDARPSPA